MNDRARAPAWAPPEAVADDAPAGSPDGWAALIQALPDPAWLVAWPAAVVVAVNDPAVTVLGRPAAALLGAPAAQMLATPEDQAYWDAAGAGPASALQSETAVMAADGRLLHVLRSVRPVPAVDGTAWCLVTLQDRTEAQAAEARHDATLAELQATLEATADGILVTDLAGRIRGFNQRFAQLWSLPPMSLQAGNDDLVQDWMRRSVHDPQGYQSRLQAVQDAALLSANDRLELLSGKVLERAARPLWSRGRPLGRVYSFRDLTDQIRSDARADALARSDVLTGLPNRRALAEQVDQAALTMRHDGDGFALLLIDLDRFRRVNDTLGHDLADAVLRDVADRLRRCLRQGDLLARIGGDQFALIVRHADTAAAETAAARILDAVAQPWMADGAAFTLTCSVGISLCPGHGRSADELLSHAEGAMRRAKQAGSNSLRFHQQQPGGDLRSDMQLDHAMRQALASGRFRLHYQPQVDLNSGRVIGAEALIRWRDPALGEVPPARFIPVAEETGFIIAIGDWVLGQAAHQAALWARAGLDVPVAVNVSALQFRQPGFVDRVAAALSSNQLAPSRLALELTESILVRDADEALQRLHALASLGVQLEIDDFGTGYSSLAYLKRFPIARLKIDRSFVKGLPGDEGDAGIVRAVVNMARALGKQVIAEGVETEPQRRFLLDIGCHAFQGYLFAPALDALSFAKRLTSPAPPGPPPQQRASVHRLPRRG